MIPLTREEALKRYSKVEKEADVFGRIIGVRRLKPSEETRVMELTPALDGTVSVTGPNGEELHVPRRIQMVMAASVCEIDGAPMPLPRTRAELDSTLDTLDQEGLAAAYAAYGRLHGVEEQPKDGVEAAKNSRRTRG